MERETSDLQHHLFMLALDGLSRAPLKGLTGGLQNVLDFGINNISLPWNITNGLASNWNRHLGYRIWYPGYSQTPPLPT